MKDLEELKKDYEKIGKELSFEDLLMNEENLKFQNDEYKKRGKFELLKWYLNNTNTSFYDFISRNYYHFSKDELKELLINLDYAIYSRCSNYVDFEESAINDCLERE